MFVGKTLRVWVQDAKAEQGSVTSRFVGKTLSVWVQDAKADMEGRDLRWGEGQVPWSGRRSMTSKLGVREKAQQGGSETEGRPTG